MKKDEMISVLAIAGVDPKMMDAMVEAYEMGLEYGVKGYKHLTDAIEAARDVCRQDRKSTRLNSSHSQQSRMPSSA